MIYELTKESTRNHPFILNGSAAFYRFIFEAITGFDYDTGCETIDCCKLNVSEAIQNEWYESAKEQGIAFADLTMQLAMNGPKVNKDLTGYQVELLPDVFVTKNASGTCSFIPGIHDKKENMVLNGVSRFDIKNDKQYSNAMTILTPTELADKYDANVLLDAFIICEVEFRLRTIHELSESTISAVKDFIITALQHDSDVMFSYDKLDAFITDKLAQIQEQKKDEITS